MADEFADLALTTLAAAIGPADTSITVVDGSRFKTPTVGYEVMIAENEDDPATVKRETVRVTGKAGNTFTVTRNAWGEGAQSFGAGASFEQRLLASSVAKYEAAADLLSTTGYLRVTKTTEPNDAEVSANQLLLWYDVANSKFAMKSKDGSGTVWRASVDLIPDLILPVAADLWLSADKEVYSDAGVTAAIADDPVQQWNDRSGNNRHVSQATLASRPILKVNVLNGKPVLRFDGSDDFMAAVFGSTLAQPNELFIVGTASTSDFYIDGTTVSTSLRTTSSGYRMHAGIALDRGTLDANFHVLGCTFNGANSELRVDGALQGTAGNAGTNGFDGVTVGANIGAAVRLSGDIAEIVVVNRLLNSTERDDVEAYFAEKYGITIP